MVTHLAVALTFPVMLLFLSNSWWQSNTDFRQAFQSLHSNRFHPR
jgi:hypothetical protein